MIKDKLSSSEFKAKLKEAIEVGIERDHYWDVDTGEEIPVSSFDSEEAVDSAINFLKKELL